MVNLEIAFHQHKIPSAYDALGIVLIYKFNETPNQLSSIQIH